MDYFEIDAKLNNGEGISEEEYNFYSDRRNYLLAIKRRETQRAIDLANEQAKQFAIDMANDLDANGRKGRA